MNSTLKMADEAARPQPAKRGAFDGLSARRKLSPVVLGVAAFVVYAGSFLLYAFTTLYGTGRLDQSLREPSGVLHDAFIAMVLGMGLIYVVTVNTYRHGLYYRILGMLRPAIDMSDEDFQTFIREKAPPRKSHIWGWAIFGIVLGVAFNYLDPRAFEPNYDPFSIADRGPLALWHRFAGCAMGAMFSVFMYASFHGAFVLVRLAAKLKPIDLFDLERLSPFALQGAANVLWVTGFTAIFATMYFLSPRYLTMVLVMAVLSALLCAVVFIVPLWGVIGRIRARKKNELARTEVALQALGPAAGLADSDKLPKAAQLITYRDFLRGTSVVPFDTVRLARVALLLLVPLWSWAASAFVARGVDIVLGFE
jgi:hypothetical protein